MIIINESSYKSIAKNLAIEVNNKTGEKTISNSNALELLAKSLGYKCYSAILPKLQSENTKSIEIYSSKNDLVDNGFIDGLEVKSTYFSTLDGRLVYSSFKSQLRIKLFHFFKALKITENQKFFITIKKKELDKYYPGFLTSMIENDLLFLELLTKTKFRYIYKNKNSDLVVYWNETENSDLMNQNEDNSDKNFFSTFNNNILEKQGMIVDKNSSFLNVKYFSWIDGYLKDEIETVSLKEADSFVYYKNDYDMRSSQHLIKDNGNTDDHKFFTENKDGLIHAKFIVENYPDVAKSILTNIYGYAEDFI